MYDEERRYVELVARSRSVVLDALEGRTVTLSYSGVSLRYRLAKRLVVEKWIPHGPDPTYADDENLIAALRQALRWNRTPAEQ